MDDQTLQQFKKQLVERQHLLLELDKASNDSVQRVELDQSRLGRLTRMDALQDQAMSQEVQRRRQIELRNILRALKRIQAGSYGYCRQCDNEIVIQRLQLDASISLCIACASDNE